MAGWDYTKLPSNGYVDEETTQRRLQGYNHALIAVGAYQKLNTQFINGEVTYANYNVAIQELLRSLTNNIVALIIQPEKTE